MNIENPKKLKNTKKKVMYFNLYYTLAICKNETGEILDFFGYDKDKEEAEYYTAQFCKDKNLTLIKLVSLNKHVDSMNELKLVTLRDKDTKEETNIIVSGIV